MILISFVELEHCHSVAKVAVAGDLEQHDVRAMGYAVTLCHSHNEIIIILLLSKMITLLGLLLILLWHQVGQQSIA